MSAGFESDYDALVPTPGGIARQGTGRDPNAIPCAGPRRRAI
jgi:hypothetical protein